MFRIALSLSLLVTSSLAEKTEVVRCKNGWHLNYRVDAKYSTWVDESDNARSSLTHSGNKIVISPEDSFQFTPEIGYGKFNDIRITLQGETEPSSEVSTGLVVSSGLDTETKDWAKEKLGHKAVEEFVVPMPKSNSVGLEMDIVSSKIILDKQDMVLCHEIEHGAHYCHTTNNVDITEVAVKKPQQDKEDILWICCHEGSGCHVMTVADKAFIVADESKLTLRGSI